MLTFWFVSTSGTRRFASDNQSSTGLERMWQLVRNICGALDVTVWVDGEWTRNIKICASLSSSGNEFFIVDVRCAKIKFKKRARRSRP